mgnify:CR=1 FL=1
MRKKDFIFPDVEEIESVASWFFPVADKIFITALKEQNKRPDFIKKYPAHLVLNHGKNVFSNAAVLSLFGNKPEYLLLEKAAISSYAGPIHDLFKGEVDTDGNDIHAVVAAKFAEDVMFGLKIPDRVKRGVVSVIRGHENYTPVFECNEKFPSEEYIFFLADLLDRVCEDRIFIVLYNTLKEGKAETVEEFMRKKWFISHKEKESIYHPCKEDKRPMLLKAYDSDVRRIIKKYKEMMKENKVKEDVEARKKRLIEINLTVSQINSKNFYKEKIIELSSMINKYCLTI